MGGDRDHHRPVGTRVVRLRRHLPLGQPAGRLSVYLGPGHGRGQPLPESRRSPVGRRAGLDHGGGGGGGVRGLGPAADHQCPGLRDRRDRLRSICRPTGRSRPEPVHPLDGAGLLAVPRLTERVHLFAQRKPRDVALLPGAVLSVLRPVRGPGLDHPDRGGVERGCLGARDRGGLQAASPFLSSAGAGGGQPRHLRQLRRRRGDRPRIHPPAHRRGVSLGPLRDPTGTERLAGSDTAGPGHGREADPVADPALPGGRHRCRGRSAPGISRAGRQEGRPVRGHRPGCLLGAQPGVPGEEPLGLAVGDPDPARQPRGPGGSGSGRAQPLPRPRRRLAVGLRVGTGGGVLIPACRLPGDVPGDETAGSGAALGGAVLLGAIVRELPDRPAPGGDRGCRYDPTVARPSPRRPKPPRMSTW